MRINNRRECLKKVEKKERLTLLKSGNKYYLCRMNYSIANPRLKVLNVETLERNPRLAHYATEERGTAGIYSKGAECNKNTGI